MKVIRQIKSYFVKIRQIVNIWQLKRAGVIFLSPPIIYGKLYTHKHKSASIIIGKSLVVRSGFNTNPISRNLYAFLNAEREDSLIRIGDYVGISGACIWAKQSIIIGDYVNIGADCILIDSDEHSLDYRIRTSGKMYNISESLDSHMAKCSAIRVENHALIGARSIILKGVTIGEGSIIGAGSVVTKNILPFSIAAGNPARVIKKIER